MVLGNMKKLAILAATVGFMTASQAYAADVTDVLDAADEVYLGTDELVKDPIDIALTPTFKQRYEWAKIKREYNQSGYVRLLNELEYERVINQMDIDFEIGMFHDLSFRMKLPIVFSNQSSYKFDTSSDKHKVDNTNSWFSNQSAGKDPNFPYKFFDLENGGTLKGKDRSGIGDMSFGIAWSPFNSERHFIHDRPWENEIGRSTITLAFAYIAPIADVRSITNDKIGSGMHELVFSVAASHRFSFVDPYIRLQYGYPVTSKDDAYKEYNSNQGRVNPGMWGRIDLGAEFIPYESIDPKFQRFVKLDLRGYFKYTAEGRAYSELADAFGQGSCFNIDGSELAAHPECMWVTEKWSNAGADNLDKMVARDYSKLHFTEDGIYDYEGFATVGGAFNVNIMPIQYVSLIAGVAVDYSQNHFITYTKVGKDRGKYDDEKRTFDSTIKDGVVSLDGTSEERSPVYNRVLDSAGSRIKRTESLNLEWFVGLRLMY